MKLILPTGALLVGIALGYFLWGSAPADEPLKCVKSEVNISRGSGDALLDSVAEQALSATNSFILSADWLEALDEQTPFQQYASISRGLSALSDGDYPRIMDALRETKSNMSWRVLEIVRRQWAAMDPRGMLAYASTLSASEARSLKGIAFREWASVDFAQAWAEVSALPEGSFKKQMVGSVLGGGVDNNPMEVLKQLDTGVVTSGRPEWVYRQVFQSIAKENPALAQQMAAAMPPGEAKQFALTGSLQTLIEEDFAAALSWLDRLPKDGSVYRVRKGMLQSLRSKDFESVRKLVESEADPKKRQEYLENIQLQAGAQNASFDEVLEMYAWLKTHSTGSLRQNNRSNLVYALAQSDLPRAIDFALELPAGNTRANALRAVANKLAQDDLQSVIQFAESLPYEDEREQVLGGISYQVMNQGVEAASAFVLEHNYPELQRRVARQLVQEWAVYDRQAALDWMAQLTDKEAFGTAQSELLKVWGIDDPQGTVGYIEAEIEESKRAKAYRDVIKNVAGKDPEAAIAWLVYLPEGGLPGDQDIYRDITYAYTDVDPLAASEWVANLEKGKLRDASVTALAQKVVRFEPDSAFIWANSVDSLSIRQDVQKRTIREWAKKDLSAAYEAVKKAQIDASEKEALFKEIESERKRQSDESSNVSQESPVEIHIVG